ncbi:hypothetical protein LR48_Vigan02g126900 [Vigna angularis]|uniref:Uncharacterized protein n=1 Tax=Phaseolus angularis TaxID=3914 RepID=A0A0L9TY55_PHAAN|nr:hypothetical protein LR48_Vigan02g126900 [Vigna angularis]
MREPRQRPTPLKLSLSAPLALRIKWAVVPDHHQSHSDKIRQANPQQRATPSGNSHSAPAHTANYPDKPEQCPTTTEMVMETTLRAWTEWEKREENESTSHMQLQRMHVLVQGQKRACMKGLIGLESETDRMVSKLSMRWMFRRHLNKNPVVQCKEIEERRMRGCRDMAEKRRAKLLEREWKVG